MEIFLVNDLLKIPNVLNSMKFGRNAIVLYSHLDVIYHVKMSHI